MALSLPAAPQAQDRNVAVFLAKVRAALIALDKQAGTSSAAAASSVSFSSSVDLSPALARITALEQALASGGGQAHSIAGVPGEDLPAGSGVVVAPDGLLYVATIERIREGDCFLGLVSTEYSASSDALVYYAGELADDAWSWSAGLPLYVGASGLTQTRPDLPVVQLAGIATAANRVLVRPEILLDPQLENGAAAELVQALRAVRLADDGYRHFDPADEAQIGACRGIAITGAGQIGDYVSVRTAGAITDSGWAWTPGPVYVGASGVLTQNVGEGENFAQVGWAESATRLLLRIERPVLAG